MRNTLSKFLGKLENFLQICQLPGGLLFKLREPSYSRGDLLVCDRLRKTGIEPKVIYDIGANIGQFAISASRVWNEAIIHSFEPVPEAFDCLRMLADKQPRIHPHSYAIGSKNGLVTIHVANALQSSSVRKLHENHRRLYPDVHEASVLNVPMRSLASILESQALMSPGLLKTDVQGFESEVLIGAGDCLRAFDWILLETSTRPMYEDEMLFEPLCELLKERGFRFTSPISIHFNNEGSFGQFDALFTRTELAS